MALPGSKSLEVSSSPKAVWIVLRRWKSVLFAL
jgi:hypothetical protein